jgi:precorrin-8X/cobalt-precorrin-8 methylmutase
VIDPQSTGLVVIGHGSSDPDAILEFQAFMRLLVAAHQGIVEYGFLEPLGIQEAIDRAVRRILADGGEKPAHLVVLPALLLGARHVKEDIPREIDKARGRHPGIDISFGMPLHLHPRVVDLCRIRIQQAVADFSDRSIDEMILLVVGRGTSDPDANEAVLQWTRQLGESLGFGRAITGYAAIASPNISEAFDIALGLPFKTIILFPYFLFTGHLVKKVYDAARQWSEIHKDRLVKVARYLGPDPAVRDAVIDRFYEAQR